ncbi:hypothetical protein JYG30_04145 [Fibrella sp. USSR17]
MDQLKRKYQKHKTEYKISVTYFLRKDRGRDGELRFVGGQLKPAETVYPIYIRVGYKQQNVKIRSRLCKFLPNDDLDGYLSQTLIKEFVDHESESICLLIKEYEETVLEFSINQWASYYSGENETLEDLLFEAMFKLFSKELEANYKREDIFTITNQLKSDYRSIKAFAAAGMPEAIKIYNSFEVLFSERWLQPTSSYISNITAWDLHTGYYQKVMRRQSSEHVEQYLAVLRALLTSFYHRAIPL